MNDKYYFFYDESEHSRSITKETITADNFSNDFIATIIGFKSKNSKIVESKYQVIEDKYKTYYSVDELKSSIIKKAKYENGLCTFKDKDIEFISDFLSFLFENKFELYITVQNKIEYVINQLLSSYENSLFIDGDALRYSVTKIINLYKPEKVIESIYANDGSFITKLRDFLNLLLKQNQKNHSKKSENEAVKQMLIILDDYEENFIINWDYRVSFEGFKLFTQERNIKNYLLIIDKEGNGKTLNAAIQESISNASEQDSKNSIGIRISDIIAGIISRFITAINNALSYKDMSDGSNLKFLDDKWFLIDEKRFECYKLLKKVIVNLNSTWYKTYCTNYSDNFLYFICLINYFDSYDSFDEYQKINIDDHKYNVNGVALNALKERHTFLQNKLPIEPINKGFENSDFYYNQRGAKCFYDYSKHEVLLISKTGSRYEVLSVGFFGKMEKGCVTIDNNGTPVCYLLPDDLMEWAFTCVSFANRGEKLFPSLVTFTNYNGRNYADIE